VNRVDQSAADALSPASDIDADHIQADVILGDNASDPLLAASEHGGVPLSKARPELGADLALQPLIASRRQPFLREVLG
jgi:hypothetical protein